jgi:ABC-type phosphate transport system substrate-binding protein
MHLPESIYKEYPCLCGNPLKCDRPFETVQEFKGAKFCVECAFPAILLEKAEIKGSGGIYQVKNYLGTRGWGRLYSGLQIKDKHPVVIKEYLLPNRCFNSQESFSRKETFKRIGGVSLADGKVQNFRILNTWEAIADEKGERCYLITKDVEPKQTLREYLREQGAMTPNRVGELLNQALQTLEFLHSQKLRLPSQQIQQGLAHGNINLDSLLITEAKNQNFYIFLCDLANWENLFIPPSINQPPLATYQQDLESLGKVGFYLLAGRDKNEIGGELLNPRESENWHTTDEHLKQYLFHLIGYGTPFDSAESARQALLKLPQEHHQNNSQLEESEQGKNHKFSRKLLIPIISLLVLLLGGGIWYFFVRNKNIVIVENYVEWSKLVTGFSDVELPPGNFNYTAESNSIWNVVLKKENQTLEKELTNPLDTNITLFNYEPIKSENIRDISQPIKEIQSSNKYFVITSLEDKITSDLDRKKIGYGGLLVFVEYRKNPQSLHQKLGGKISLQDLRQIYTGQKTYWNEINPKFPREKIKPYIPEEPEAVYQFKKIVLQNNSQDIAKFQKIVTPENTETTIRNATNTGIISFGTLGRIGNQCSDFYPLAIVNSNNKSIQPRYRSIRNGNRPINLSDGDLCSSDTYFDVKTFESYPLGYPLYVVYPNDNTRNKPGQKFAEMLGKTQQGQCLLNKVGLVPLQQIPNNLGKCKK